MTPDELTAEISRAIADRHLLQHPFYQRWERGELGPGELGAYAAQYRHFEAALPTTLRGVIAGLPAGPAADLVERNLHDEETNPKSHVELFETFAQAVGAPADAPPAPATRALLDTYGRLVAGSGAEGLAALVAYEVQAPAISASKADGLRRHYGCDADATAFWDVHATMDSDHAGWAIAALAELPVAAARTTGAARAAADAWWAFLDEREAEGRRATG